MTYMHIEEPMLPTQRFMYVRFSDGWWDYKLLEERNVDGFNVVCLHGKHQDGDTKYVILVDISKYREGVQTLHRFFNDFNTIPYPEVVFKSFHLKDIKFGASITSPGYWDNGFSTQCILYADILSFSTLREEMKYELKTGITIKDELHKSFDSIVDEIVPEVTKFTDCISALAPIEYPSTEIYTNRF